MNLTVSVRVLSSDQKDLAVRNCKGATSPKRVFHSHGKHLPNVFVHFIKLNTIIDLLFCWPKETTEGIDAIVTNGTCTQVMSLIFHRSNLGPFVLSNAVFLNRAKALLTRETTENENSSFANGNGVGVPTFIHLSFVQNLVFLIQIYSCIFLWWGSSTGNEDFHCTQSDWGRALVKLMAGVICKFLYGPFILIDIITKTYLRIDVVSKQVDVRLSSGASIKRWEFE